MANINLLPWREELRAEKRNDFLAQVVLCAIAAAIFIALWVGKIGSDIDEQVYRNEFIQKNIAELNGKIKEIDALRSRREQLVARMEVIQGLQGNRAVIVHLFDAFVRVLPDGVVLESISKKGNRMTLSGVAPSTNGISSLMRNIDASEWLTAPVLSRVVAANDAGTGAFGEEAPSRFTLSAKVSNPNKKQDEGPG